MSQTTITYPKPSTYSFDLSCAEEAALVNRQLSSYYSFVRGDKVKITAYNQESYDTLYAAVESARKAVAEELKAIIEERKIKRIETINSKRLKIDSMYNIMEQDYNFCVDKLKKLLNEINCEFITEFGNFNMEDDSNKINELIDQLNNILSLNHNSRIDMLAKLDDEEEKINNALGIKEIEKISSIRVASDCFSIKHSFKLEIDSNIDEINNRFNTLKVVTDFLKKLSKTLSENGLDSFKYRFDKIVNSNSVFDKTIIDKLNIELKQTMDEVKTINTMKSIEKEKLSSREDANKLMQILKDLENELITVKENINLKSTVEYSYRKENIEEYKKIEDKINKIIEFNYISEENIDSLLCLKANVENVLSSLDSENTLDELRTINNDIDSLNKKVEKEDDLHSKFTLLYDEYSSLYIRMTGIIDGEISSEEYENPANIFFNIETIDDTNSYLNDSIKYLKEELHKVEMNIFMNSIKNNILMEESNRIFREEVDDNGFRHILFINMKKKGIIFDATTLDGINVSINQLGVTLSNGVPLIDKETYKKACSSCDEANNIVENFKKIGIDSICGEDVTNKYDDSVYDEQNYYKIESAVLSLEYLQLMGYQIEEIVALGYSSGDTYGSTNSGFITGAKHK